MAAAIAAVPEQSIPTPRRALRGFVAARARSSAARAPPVEVVRAAAASDPGVALVQNHHERLGRRATGAPCARWPSEDCCAPESTSTKPLTSCSCSRDPTHIWRSSASATGLTTAS